MSTNHAKREAYARLRDQNGLNGPGDGIEFAYSPATGAVGLRWQFEPADRAFRVFNVNYPMYGRSDQVTDWISVGISTPRVRPLATHSEPAGSRHN